jgi:hypothetical protein
MTPRFTTVLACGLVLLAAAPHALAADGGPLPVRGLHVAAPMPDEMDLALRLIAALAKEGVNTLVVEINYRFVFARRPEVSDERPLTAEQLRALADACRNVGIRFIPGVNLLGHQSWAKKTFGLLRAHPELDETPGLHPQNEGIYCRSYCPLHPKTHEIVFDVVDEIAEAAQADAVHVGMDEVFLIGEEACPRCRGKSKAELFAGEVRALRDHLAASGRQTWLWGDRLLDGETTGIGEWEAAKNGTAPALQLLPKDVVICDWHYEQAWPTALHFAVAGLPVVSSAWRRPRVALEQLDLVRAGRSSSGPPLDSRLLGVLHTTWTGFGPFASAYFGEGPSEPPAIEAALAFKELFRELRDHDLR